MRAETTPRSPVSIFRSCRAGTIRVTSFLNMHRRIETMDYADAAAVDLVMEFNSNGLQIGTEMNSARACVRRMAASDRAAPYKARASGEFKIGLIAAIPRLRAFAILLSGNTDRADDLLQETLAKALQNFGSYSVRCWYGSVWDRGWGLIR